MTESAHRVEAPAAFHPLDPLSADEIRRAAAAVRGCEGCAGCRPDTRFVTMGRREPVKDAVLAFADGGGERPPREADVVLLDRGGAASVEASVSLETGEVTSWRRRSDVQPMAVV